MEAESEYVQKLPHSLAARVLEADHRKLLDLIPLEQLIRYGWGGDSFNTVNAIVDRIHELSGTPRVPMAELRKDMLDSMREDGRLHLWEIHRNIKNRLSSWNTCAVGEASSFKSHWRPGDDDISGPDGTVARLYLTGTRAFSTDVAQKLLNLGVQALDVFVYGENDLTIAEMEAGNERERDD